MAGGRPFKLDADFIAKCYAYLDSYEEAGKIIPSIAGLSLATGVHRSTLQAWIAGNLPNAPESVIAEFSDIVDTIAAEQEEKLLSGGLSGSYNATITKLVLSKHNYTDKVEQDVKSSDGSMSNTIKVSIVKPE